MPAKLIYNTGTNFKNIRVAFSLYIEVTNGIVTPRYIALLKYKLKSLDNWMRDIASNFVLIGMLRDKNERHSKRRDITESAHQYYKHI